ncbi:YybH family protein [Algihabitans albus]|uniref:YybH family protein n=1 Tax=Algihabitans albus TaxID=2164067 RepID=UPI000E5D0326|nr:nuclear transport factor 2 family protein [Algihabitans albus]
MPLLVQDHGPKEDVEAIRAQCEGWIAAFIAKDVDKILTYYAPGDELISYDIMPPLEYSGLEVYRESWKNFFGSFQGDPGFEHRDMQIKCSGDVGFVTNLIRVSGNMGGKDASMWLRETHCFQKIDGTWLLVHDHVSVPMDMASGRALTDLTP